MIITQLNWKFKFSNRTGILSGRHSQHKMRVIEIGFISIGIIPTSSEGFYWDSLNKLAMDKDYLIKNNDKIEKAVKQAEVSERARLVEIFNDENKRLRFENEKLSTRLYQTDRDIASILKTIELKNK